MPVAVLKNEVIKRAWGRARQSAVVYGALATAVRVGSNLLLIPLVLQVLPPPELAVWYVFLALGAFANLADFGFGAAITRIYSFLWAGAEDFDTEGLGPPPQNHSPNYVKLRQFHSAVRTVYVRIALVAIAVLIVTGALCLIRPIRAVDHPATTWLCWAGFVLSIAYSLGTNYWVLACQGINRMQALQKAQLISGLAYLLMAALMLMAGSGLFSMVAAMVVRSFVVRHMCRRTYLEAVPAAQEPESDLRSIVARIWPNARKVGIVSLGGYLTQQAHVLICSHFFASQITASYGLTAQLAGFINTFSTLWLLVKWPQITMLRTQGRVQEMGVLFARRLAATLVSFAAMAILLIAAGNRLLEWRGTQTQLLPTAYLAIFLLNCFQQLVYAQFGLLTFTENIVPFVKLSIFSGIATVVLGALLASQFGLWGLILAPLLSTASSCLWYVTRRGFHGQPLNVQQFARAAVFGHV
jgi:O-antigen/teichoic acid export membrane protein